jgi:carboxymethylenebutenolidase
VSRENGVGGAELENGKGNWAVSECASRFESEGKTIAVDCFVPEGNGRCHPAVIGLHGSGGGHARMAAHARLLAEQGFAVYIPHYFDRTGTTGLADKATAVRNFPAWGKTLWDAITFVERQDAVDGGRIGLLGFSLGAYLAMSVAVVDPRVRAVVEFFGGLPKEMKFFMRRLCPVLILHGEEDATVPVEEAHHLREVLQKKNIPYEMQIYPGVGHGFSGDTWLDATVRMAMFLEKYVANIEA